MSTITFYTSAVSGTIPIKTLNVNTDYTCGIWQKIDLTVSKDMFENSGGTSLSGLYFSSPDIGKSVYIDDIISGENFNFTKNLDLAPDSDNVNNLVLENGGLTYRKNMNGEYNVLPTVNVQSFGISKCLANGIKIINQDNSITSEVPATVSQTIPKIEDELISGYTDLIPANCKITTTKPTGWSGSFYWIRALTLCIIFLMAFLQTLQITTTQRCCCWLGKCPRQMLFLVKKSM